MVINEIQYIDFKIIFNKFPPTIWKKEKENTAERVSNFPGFNDYPRYKSSCMELETIRGRRWATRISVWYDAQGRK